MNAQTGMLDQLVPLSGASHADVETYSISIPTRYAECVAVLRDGREARFRDPRALVGWSGPVERRRFLFSDGQQGAEIRINNNRRRPVRRVRALRKVTILGQESLASKPRGSNALGTRNFVGRDGDMLYVRTLGALGVMDEQATTDRKAAIGMDPEPALEGCHP